MTTPQTAFALAKVAAIQAEIEGMKAKNEERRSDGFALAYDDNAFFDASARLEQIAIEVINQ